MPWTNYWYLIAFGAVASAISLVYETLYIIFFYDAWILYLFFFHNLKRGIVFGCIISTVFFYMYFPSATAPKIEGDFPATETFTGKITGPVIKTDNRIEFVLKDSQGDKLLIFYFKETESIYEETSIRSGASCVLLGERNTPEQASNPHQFDYRDYLWKKGISYQLHVSSLENISCVNHSIIDRLYTLRTSLMEHTTDKYEENTAIWLHALVLGDDHLLDDELVDLFQRWGLSHLLAISGLHIGIIVALMYFIFIRFSLLTKEKAQTVLLFFLPIYAVVAGGQPSVWRASLMVVLVMLLAKFKSKINYPDIISIIFILLMLLDKQIIYHVGFQLSFAVTFALIISRKWLAQSTTNLESIFKISFVSQMAILPLQLHYFFIFQPLAILLNIIIVPYFSIFVIPLMFLFLLTSIFPKVVLVLPEKIFHLIHHQVIQGLRLLDEYLDIPFIIGEFSLIFVVIYYMIFIMMMIYLEKGKLGQGFLYGSMLSIYIIFLALRPYLSPYGTVTMLDIGQGDAFVIEMPYGKGVFLVDAGATFSFTDMEASDKVYRQVIRPYLYGQGIRTIDTIFISHEDLDHDGSVSFLLDDFSVKEILVSPYYELNEQKDNEWENISIASFNEMISHGEQLFYIVSPKEKTNSANENSLVIYTEIGGLSWLFTGDIGKETERQITQNYQEMQLDVLKVGHHGSNTSTDPIIAERTSGGVALISVGENNTYGHPTNDVINTLEQQQIRILRTDKHGAVQYRFKKNNGVFIPFFSKGK